MANDQRMFAASSLGKASAWRWITSSSASQQSGSTLARPTGLSRAYAHTAFDMLFALISGAVSSAAISSTFHAPCVGTRRIVPSAHRHVPIWSARMSSAVAFMSASSFSHLSSSGTRPRVAYAQKRLTTFSGFTIPSGRVGHARGGVRINFPLGEDDASRHVARKRQQRLGAESGVRPHTNPRAACRSSRARSRPGRSPGASLASSRLRRRPTRRG